MENNTLFTSKMYQSFILPWWWQVLWTVLFAGMVVVAIVGNLVVICTVLTNKQMRSVTNYFLVNLSVADAMMSTLNVAFILTYILNGDWPFGHLYCKICQFISMLSISASVFTLLAISVDRYLAIMKPLRPRLGKRVTLAIIAGIWLLGSIISSPNLSTQWRVCFWPIGKTRSELELWYNICVMTLTYVLPVVSMTYTYFKMGIELWSSQPIGESTENQQAIIKSKRRVVKMLIVVVVAFAVCWLPYHAYYLVTTHYPDVAIQHKQIYLCIYWLAISNTMYNPIILYCMNSNFRKGFQKIFWRCGAFGRGGLGRGRRKKGTSFFKTTPGSRRTTATSWKRPQVGAPWTVQSIV